MRSPNRSVACNYSIMPPPKTLKGQNSHKSTRFFLYSCNRVEQERPDAINGAALVSSTFPQQTKETTTADKRAQTCNDHSPFTVIHLPSRSRGTAASFFSVFTLNRVRVRVHPAELTAPSPTHKPEVLPPSAGSLRRDVITSAKIRF